MASYRIERAEHPNSIETNIRIQFHIGTSEDACFALLDDIVPKVSEGYSRKTLRRETNASFAHEPIATAYIVDAKI